MLRWIGGGVVVVLIFLGGWMLYNRNNAANRLGSGDVVSRDAPPSSTDSGDLDGRNSGAVGPTPSRSDAPGTINGVPVAGAGAATNQPPASAKAPIATDNPPANLQSNSPMSPLPVSDTISPNPPNGLAFGGTGKFQWYRQGNLTWRVNTESGSSCIAFATMEEWRKQIVYSHGCGNA